MARLATALVAGVLALVLLPFTAPAASAPSAQPRALEPFELELVEGGLLLRGGEEPQPIGTPTVLAGTYSTGEGGTGAMTGVGFTSPTISFSTDITDPVVATVFIDATFSQVTPGSGTGSIDPDGNVTIQTALKVDLHIEVIGLEADCTSQPVNLTLESTAPYDPVTKRVTLEDANFTVPAAPTGGACQALVADGINERLAGPGHSIEMTFEGELVAPPPVACPTITTLTPDPADGIRHGDEVTLGASVAMDPEAAGTEPCEDAPVHPAGLLDFYDGQTLLGTTSLVDGTASLATSDLPIGLRDLTARYRGEPPYGRSTSAVEEYLVASPPHIVTTLPDQIQIGVATPFEVEVDHTDFGFPLPHARLDVSLGRSVGTGAFTPDRVLLERFDGEAWVPVPLTAPALRRALGTVEGPFALLPGDERTVPMRITFQPEGAPTPTLPLGRLDVAFEVVEVDGEGAPAPALAPAPAAVASSAREVVLVDATRRPTSIVYRVPFIGPPIQAQVVRQGYTFGVPSPVLSGASGTTATGDVQVLLDGSPLPIRRASNPVTPLAEGFLPRLPLFNGTIGVLSAQLPPDVAPGLHTVQVRYLGDAVHAPSTSPETALLVRPRLLPVYECQAPLGLNSVRFNVLVEAHANVPRYARDGSEVPLGQLDVSLRYDRGTPSSTLAATFGTGERAVGTGRLSGIRFGFGQGGTGTATSLTRTGTVLAPPNPEPADWKAAQDPDQTVTFAGEQATLAVGGDPGEAIPVALDSINLDFTAESLTPASTFLCQPVGDPIELGEVTVAGTDLTVTPTEDVRTGDEVALSATVAPAGVPGNVVFSDNGDTVAVVPVDEAGVATTTAPIAEDGEHVLHARFFGGGGVLSTEDSETIQVTALDCGAFDDPGNGRVVRLVYMELLRRCPDPAGYAHWTNLLDTGTSREAFARTIAKTAAARGVIVDDAYELMLERAPDPGGRAYWVEKLGQRARYDALLADLGASAEFWQKAGSTDEGFVERVYQRLLQRPADAGGLAHWTGLLESGTTKRALVIRIFNRDEPLTRVIEASFDEILDRAPAAEERDEWIPVFRRDSNRSDLYAALIATQEFADRAQTRPNFG